MAAAGAGASRDWSSREEALGDGSGEGPGGNLFKVLMTEISEERK